MMPNRADIFAAIEGPRGADLFYWVERALIAEERLAGGETATAPRREPPPRRGRLIASREALVAMLTAAKWDVHVAATKADVAVATVYNAMQRFDVKRPGAAASREGSVRAARDVDAREAFLAAAPRPTPAPPPPPRVLPAIVKATPRPMATPAPAKLAAVFRPVAKTAPPAPVAAPSDVDALERPDQSFACLPLGKRMLASRCVDRQRDATVDVARMPEGEERNSAHARALATARCAACRLGRTVAAKVAEGGTASPAVEGETT